MNTKDILLYTIIILAVVGLGLLAVNQTLEYMYRAQFLGGPCKLCTDLNPSFKQCLDTTPAPVNARGPLSNMNITIGGMN